MNATNKGNLATRPAKIAGALLVVLALFASLFAGTLRASEAPAPTDESDFRSGVKVCVIPIHGEVDERMLFFVKRSIEIAKENDAEYFVLDVNTPGGRLDIMIDIGADIAALKDDGITSVAFVNGDATSAGSYITLSCDKIIMAAGATIGSAAPVFVDATGNRIKLEDDDEYRIKVVAYCKSKFRAMAKRKGHNPDLAEAMVDYKIVLFEETTKDANGNKTSRIVTPAEKNEIEATQKTPAEDGQQPQQNITFKTFVPDDDLLNLDDKQAVDYGLAVTSVDNGLDGVYKYLKLSSPDVTVLEESLEENLFNVLNHPLLRILLIILGVGGIFLEIKTPGFGVPGIVGGASILLLILISFVVGTANIWEVMLVFAGIVLLALEIFVIPGFGVAGVAGLLCIVVGILLSMLPFTIPQTDWAWDYLTARVRDMVLGFAGAIALILVLIRFLPSAPMFRRITLATAAGVEEGFIAANTGQKSLLGKTGTAVTKLRPVGKAEFDGEQYQVVADGDFIEPGCTVEVISVSGNSLTVRKVN